MPRLVRQIFQGFALLLVFASAAQAQIYAWRDANGVLVLSHRPKSAAVMTYAVAKAEGIRASRPGMVLRQSSFDGLIEEHAGVQHVRPDLVRAVIQVESAFNPRALSPKGAMGLMQLMPGTAADLGVRDPYNPAQNIKAGVTYLKQLLTKYQDDESLALAAYNAGPAAVDRYGQRVPPYRETRDYVSRIQSATPGAPPVPSPPAATQFYRALETVGGATVPRFTNVRPKAGPYDVVSQDRR